MHDKTNLQIHTVYIYCLSQTIFPFTSIYFCSIDHTTLATFKERFVSQTALENSPRATSFRRACESCYDTVQFFSEPQIILPLLRKMHLLRFIVSFIEYFRNLIPYTRLRAFSLNLTRVLLWPPSWTSSSLARFQCSLCQQGE